MPNYLSSLFTQTNRKNELARDGKSGTRKAFQVATACEIILPVGSQLYSKTSEINLFRLDHDKVSLHVSAVGLQLGYSLSTAMGR